MASIRVRIITEPIELWTLPDVEPERPAFKAKWTATRMLLDRELWALEVVEAVLELDVLRSQLRNDGEIRAGARPASGRARLTFTVPAYARPDGEALPMSIACAKWGDGYGIPAWQANARAIGLTLEALRAAGRYGAARGAEQYTGYRALPAGAR